MREINNHTFNSGWGGYMHVNGHKMSPKGDPWAKYRTRPYVETMLKAEQDRLDRKKKLAGRKCRRS